MTTIDDVSAQRKEGSLRILHVSNRLSTRGGADQYLLGLLSIQQKQHDIKVLCGRVDNDVEFTCDVALSKGLDARTAQPVELVDRIQKINPDIIHVHNVVNPAALNQLKGLPVVVTVQDHRFFCPGRGKLTLQNDICEHSMSTDACGSCFEDKGYFQDISQITQNRLDAIKNFHICVLSRYMRKELLAVGQKESSIQVIPPFVHNLPKIPSTGHRNTVLFAGRLVAAKGVHDVVAAWQASGTELPLVFAGTGTERSALEARGHRVLGWLNREQMAQAYAEAAVVVMPSRWQEPFGIVGLEALSMGTPVVAWESGGISEWLTADRIVPWGDIEGLGRAIKHTIGSTATLPEQFKPMTIATRIDSMYSRILGG